MKKIIKISAILAVLLFSVLLISSCSSGDAYKKIGKEGYNVSVKFDIGEGMFAGRQELVLVDVFNLNNEKENANGQKEITVLPPDSALRGSEAFDVAYSGHYFVGWYQNRHEVKDADGNISYTYSGKWDFNSDKLTLDPNKDYSADEPVLTLYAAWVPLTNFEIYSQNQSGKFELIKNVPASYIEIPQWDESTGSLTKTNFPTRDGYTFDCAYTDEACTKKITETQLFGNIDYENGVLLSDTVKVYVTWLEGSWYKIYNAKSFASINDTNANYEICANLDFSSVNWKNTAFAKETFNGTIVGNGHMISNIYAFNQDATEGGIFKSLGANASIKDVTFKDVSYKIDSVPFRTQSVCFGLLASKAADGAVLEGVSFEGDCKIIIENNCLADVPRPQVDYIFGDGNNRGLESENITIEGLNLLAS